MPRQLDLGGNLEPEPTPGRPSLTSSLFVPRHVIPRDLSDWEQKELRLHLDPDVEPTSSVVVYRDCDVVRRILRMEKA